ncbi:MAG: hypothetical protein P8127_10625 [Acidobacteriota bacterium]
MTKWRVMTVDDSAAILTIIAAYLEDSEFEVIDPDAFVVIVSSLGTEDAVHECLTTGARSFLQKPFTRDDFVEFMRDLTQVA